MEYNNRTYYDCFDNPFTDYFGSPDLNIYPITIDDRPHPHKIACHTPYLIPAEIYVASENYSSTLTTPSDSPDLLHSDDPNPLRVMNKNGPYSSRVKGGYCCRKHDEKDVTKRQGSIDPCALIKTRNFMIVMGFPE